ncbi:hypothetical protein [Vibrio phage VP16T]|nr:hypothetical protein [Vibrio phage VP16T]
MRLIDLFIILAGALCGFCVYLAFEGHMLAVMGLAFLLLVIGLIYEVSKNVIN